MRGKAMRRVVDECMVARFAMVGDTFALGLPKYREMPVDSVGDGSFTFLVGIAHGTLDQTAFAAVMWAVAGKVWAQAFY